MKYEFAIRKIVLSNETEIYIPLVREYSRFIKNKWDRIVQIYDRFILMELDFDVQLTHTQCEEHIAGYRKTILNSRPISIKNKQLVGLTTINL